MRKIFLICFVCFLMLLFVVPLYAQQTFISPGDFSTKFWKEKYLGGGDGQPGNVLMAAGEGFDFQNAVLNHVAIPQQPIPVVNPCGLGGPLNATGYYLTTYTGGRLTLNPSGPWRDNIIVNDITAINLSGLDEGSKKFFILSFSGTSTSGVPIDVTVTWCEANDNNYVVQGTKNKPVFQQGTVFNASIDIYR
jgi:hypothetical protein